MGPPRLPQLDPGGRAAARTAGRGNARSAAACTCTRVSDRRGSHTDTPALPFCTATLTREWKAAGYPITFNHLGDHLRKRRLDLGLQMKQAAKLLGAHAQSFANWEEGRTAPAILYIPRLIHFVGYDPRPVPEDLAGRLIHHRVGLGMSQETFARLLGVDPGTLRRWERTSRQPQGDVLKKVNAALNAENRH